MYVCTYVFMYVCVLVCMYVFVLVCMYVCMYVCTAAIYIWHSDPRNILLAGPLLSECTYHDVLQTRMEICLSVQFDMAHDLIL